MARLEQYTFEVLPFSAVVGAEGLVEITDEHGARKWESLRVAHVDVQGHFVRMTGRAQTSGADFTVKMSDLSDGGFLTLSFPGG